MSEEEELKANLDLITNTISVCIETGHSAMSDTVSEAARNYYLSIVNDLDMSAEQKRTKIYHDLVVGTKTNLLQLHNNNDQAVQYTEKQRQLLSVSYRIGLNTEIISKAKGEILCVGQYTENDIHVASKHVSRIHCFIFRIDDKLIVLDGWSKCGTSTVNVAANHDNISDNEQDDGAEEQQHVIDGGNQQTTKDTVVDDDDGDDEAKAKAEAEANTTNMNLTKNDPDMILHSSSLSKIKRLKTTQDEKGQEEEEEEEEEQKNNKQSISVGSKNDEERECEQKLVHSLPQQRNVLQFNVGDTIHLQLGRAEWGTHLILNPKLCIVCLERARTLRLKCGHQVLCNQCHEKIAKDVYAAKCPICCREFNMFANNQFPHHVQNANISAGVHTYRTSALSCTQ